MKLGRRKNSIPPREIRKAFDLYLDKTTQKQIAKELKVSPMTIHRWAKKYEWKKEREKYIVNWMKEVIKKKIINDERSPIF